LDRLLAKLSKTRQGVYHTWFHLKARNDAEFKDRVQQLIAWADVALVEYTYWAAPVRDACRKRNIREIVTDHDVLSDQVKSPSLQLLTRRLEFSALARADAAVSVAA